MRILSKKKLKQLLKRMHEDGLKRGYELGYLMGRMPRSHRGCILGGYDVQREVDAILKREG